MPKARSQPRVMLFLLLLTACLAGAQTTTKSTAAATKKRTSGKNVKVSLSKTAAAGHGRTTTPASHEEAIGGSARVRARKVVVTRKLVHGKWVRTTKIVRAEAGPSFQTHPDQERYQQIQQALAQKGYFKGQANGVWGPDSLAALKQFQTDRKISNEGKISSLSLINLGLGPNRETAAVKTDAAAPATAADPAHNQP